MLFLLKATEPRICKGSFERRDPLDGIRNPHARQAFCHGATPQSHTRDLSPGRLESIFPPCYTVCYTGSRGRLLCHAVFSSHISSPCSSHNSSQNHLPFNPSPSAPTLVRTGLGKRQDAVSQTPSVRRWVQTSQLCLGTALPPLREFLCETSSWRGGSHKKAQVCPCRVLTKNFTLCTSSSPQNSSRPAPPASSFFGGGGGGVFLGGSGGGSGTSFSPFSVL